jgi:hypothetical protein
LVLPNTTHDQPRGVLML